MAQAQIPQASYPTGATVAGSRTFAGVTVTDGRVVVDGSLFTDPAVTVEAKIEFQFEKNGAWQHVVSATQTGSPTGWATKFGTTTNAFDFAVSYQDGIRITGARLTFTVTNGPVTLGPVTLSWS